MTQPLILLLYEKVLPGGQLLNRLQDLGYRVRNLSDPGSLVEEARQEKPLLVLVDVEPNSTQACAAISSLRANPETSHIPVIAFATADNLPLHGAAHASGATLVANHNALNLHLEPLLSQALQVD